MVSISTIIEKRNALYSLTPFSEGVKALKRRMDLLDFAYSDLRLFGSALTREGAKSILVGNAVPGVPVFEHRLCEAHRKLLSCFDGKLDMGLDVDSSLLNEFCKILSGTGQPLYRKGEPLLYHLDFVPTDDTRVPIELAEILAAIRRADRSGAYNDFCHKAAALHTGIIKVYPYQDGYSELAARAAMQYEIMRAGYFPIDIGISEPVYNTVCSNAIRRGDVTEFADLLRNAIVKKLLTLIEAVRRGV